MKKLVVALAIVLSGCFGLPTLEATQSPQVIPSATALATKNTMPTLEYRVIASVLEKRTGPGESFANAGYLFAGDTVIVNELRAGVGNEVCQAWASVGDNVWVCFDWLEAVK